MQVTPSFTYNSTIQRVASISCYRRIERSVLWNCYFTNHMVAIMDLTRVQLRVRPEMIELVFFTKLDSVINTWRERDSLKKKRYVKHESRNVIIWYANTDIPTLATKRRVVHNSCEQHGGHAISHAHFSTAQIYQFLLLISPTPEGVRSDQNI